MSASDRRATDSLDGDSNPEFDSKLVDAVAWRVLELLGERGNGEIQLLTVAQVARCFQVHPNWVYANARRLGAVRLGGGPKAPLRFNPEHVSRAIEQESRLDGPHARETPLPTAPITRRMPAARRKRGLLPIADA